MPGSAYRYVLELFDQDGRRLGQHPVDPDWEPAREWLRFSTLCQALSGSASSQGPVDIQPVWSTAAGAPYVGSFRAVMTLDSHDPRPAICEIPTAYLRSLAQDAATGLVERGLLKEGDTFRYLVSAYPAATKVESHSTCRFNTEEVSPPSCTRVTPLATLQARATPFGEIGEDPFPLFVPEAVLAEGKARVQRAGPVETGGLLVGHLHQDAASGGPFLEVTAQIPAAHTEADKHRLRFTPATWQSAQAALELRRRGEQIVGWWHSHPAQAWCSTDCAPEKRAACPLSRPFFSKDDLLVHRVVFTKAFCVALLLTHLPSGTIQFTAFGWRQGMVQSRGFSVLDPSGSLAPAPLPSPTLGGNEHATPCTS
ncbi:MAG: hypothetical protein FJ387_21460 [Verrucomicrobia bacterium]|nr:hypothetical protein [Verrucomicrobiota bacterium]